MKTSRFLLTILAAAAVMPAGCVKNDPRPVITITTQPTAPATLTERFIPADIKLTVAASVTEGATLSYQWYSNTSASNSGGTAIDGATSASYTLPTTLATGTHYYFCEISAERATTTRTNAVTVTVNAPRNSRISWDKTAKRYILTTDPTDAGLFFKFGSVMGIFSGNGANQVLPGTNTDTFDTGDIAWNVTGATDWVGVPSYTTADHPANIDAAYHTAANVKAGKGDPCRLVGLDLAKIKSTASGSLSSADIDNGLWRLPTQEENTLFTGQEYDIYYTDHWTSQKGVNGGMFPSVTDGSEDSFLPATGSYRSDTNDGIVTIQGSSGIYWSATPRETPPYGHMLFFTEKRIGGANSITSYDTALFIRCVRQ